jgi:uncharacterized UBP type Zn finger protein
VEGGFSSVEKLIAFGFSRVQAEEALAKTGGSIEDAVSLLLG